MGERLSKKDVEKIEKEIEERKLVTRHKLLESVKEARAQGDLSENFEYHAAKREKNQNESRIRYLERMLRNAEVIEDESIDDEAGLDKTVTVLFLDDQCEETYRLVTSIREDVLHGLVSIESPVGRALIGHKAGETVQVQLPDGGGYGLEILKVESLDNGDNDKIKKF